MHDITGFITAFIAGLILAVLALRALARPSVKSEADWSDTFKALASDVLRANNESFLQLAENRLKQNEITAVAALEKKSTAIDELMKPVKDTLTRLDSHIQALEVKREGAYRELTEMVKLSQETQRQLRGETGQLLQALRAPTARGTWGQLQLRRILEMTGMSSHAKDFSEQKSMAGSDGVLRPDFIVNLPGERCVVFDSKVPLSAYLDFTNSTDEAEKKLLLITHAKHVRDHIRALSAKEYWSLFDETPEFVVLFIPGDHLLGAALDEDSGLMDYATNQRVVLATPTTVIALLWAVAYGWKQEALRDNVQKIADMGGDLYASLATMTKYFSELGAKLGASVKSYNEVVGSLERNVLSKARRLKEYGLGKDGKILPEVLESLDVQPRLLEDIEKDDKEDAA